MRLNIVKYRFLCLAISALLLIPGIAAMIYSSVTYETHTPLRVGIDYTGGTILQYGTSDLVSTKQIAKTREALEKIGVDNPYIQVLKENKITREDNGINSIVSIRTHFIKEGSELSENITNIMKSEYKNSSLIQFTSVGATLGKELFHKSLIALSLAILAMFAYI